MTPQRVTLITLGVSDLARAKAFYGALGWTPTNDEGEVVFYQINGMVLGFFGLGPLAKDQGRPDAQLGTGAMTLAQNFNTEAEVDAAFAPPASYSASPLAIFARDPMAPPTCFMVCCISSWGSAA